LISDLLVIVPSRGRPQSIARLLDAVHATAKMETYVHIAVDEDDPALDGYKQVMSHAAAAGIAGKGTVLEIGSRKNLTEWTNKIAIQQADNYPYLASFGDDHVPCTPGWDKALITVIERAGGTGFAYPWDETREDIPEAVVMSSNIVKALGWMAYPGCTHWYIDTIWADLGRGIGVLKHLRAIKVEQVRKTDQTSIESSEKLDQDRSAYYEWRHTRMADDIKTLIALNESKVLETV
jgi:hypothetical protein